MECTSYKPAICLTVRTTVSAGLLKQDSSTVWWNKLQCYAHTTLS